MIMSTDNMFVRMTHQKVQSEQLISNLNVMKQKKQFIKIKIETRQQKRDTYRNGERKYYFATSTQIWRRSFILFCMFHEGCLVFFSIFLKVIYVCSSLRFWNLNNWLLTVIKVHPIIKEPNNRFSRMHLINFSQVHQK